MSCFPLVSAAEKNARLRERAILQSLILGKPVDSISYDDRWFLRQRGFQVPQTTSGFEITSSAAVAARLGWSPHDTKQRAVRPRLQIRSAPRIKATPLPTRAATASNLVAAAWEARVSAPSPSTPPPEMHETDLMSGLVLSLTRTHDEERFGVTLHSTDHAQPPIVSRLTAGGPAEASGLRSGDVILSIAGTHVHGHEMATDLLHDLPVGQISSIVVRRVVSGSAPSSFKTPRTTPHRGEPGGKADDSSTPIVSSPSSAASATAQPDAESAAIAAAPPACAAAPPAAADPSERLDQLTQACSRSADTACARTSSGGCSESVPPTTRLALTPTDGAVADEVDTKTTCAAAPTPSESKGPSVGRSSSFPSPRTQPMPPKPTLRLSAKDQAKVDRVSSQISALELKRAQERAMAIVRVQAAARRRLARREFVDMRDEDARQQWIDYYLSHGVYDEARKLGWDDQHDVASLHV